MLSSLTVRYKLLLLVIPFAVLAGFLLTQQSYRQYQALQSLRHEEQLADIASLSAELIDTLQTERGLSNGFLNGSGPLPASLQTARGKADAAFAAFSQAATTPAGADLKLGTQVNATQAVLASRTDIDTRKLTAPAAFAAYTQAIRQLMATTGELQNATADGLLLRYSTTLSNLLCVKEMAGRERGFVNGVLTKGGFDQPQLAQALSMKAAQEACQGQMLELAPLPMREQLGSLLQSPAMQTVQTLRDGIYATPLGQPTSVPASQWFDQATARIVELKQGQTRLLNEMKAAIRTQAADYRQLLIMELATLSVMTILLALGGRAVYRSIHNPLVALEAMMTGMSQDLDLGRRAQLASSDEIGKMGKALDHLLDAFVATLASVNRGSDKLLTAASTLQGVSARAAAAAEDQSSSSTQIAAAVEQMTVGIQSVSDNTQDNLHIVRHMQQGVHQGRKQMQSTTDAIQRTAGTVIDAEKLIISLAEKSQNIHHIITAIREIADQTNLLALNAAIEAARAGEMGRGFAVVADEVRKLAERTGKETVQITTLVESITQETQQAATSMLQAREEMEAGTQLIADTLRELDDMHRDAENVAGKSRETAVAMQQQSSVSNEVAVNISKIATLAEDNSVIIQEVAALADTLNHTAQELAQHVQRFHAENRR